MPRRLKRDITVEHLLTMSSGLACDDWNDASPGNENKMYKAVRLGAVHPDALISTYVPGLVNQYCTGGRSPWGASWWSGKQPIPSFAAAKLFGPLGDCQHQPAMGRLQQPHADRHWRPHLPLRPRDMSKIRPVGCKRGGMVSR